jgi:cytochrome c oxidase cbb3-type subunit IV
MDLDVLRPLMTVILFCVFLCIVMWAWNGKQRERFEAAARLPLDEDDDALYRAKGGSGRSWQ